MLVSNPTPNALRISLLGDESELDENCRIARDLVRNDELAMRQSVQDSDGVVDVLTAA